MAKNNKNVNRYEVIEDNGGGLMLYVFADDGNVEYAHGYEGSGCLLHDIEAIENGADPAHDWDGNEEDPQAYYDSITSFEHGWKVVADNEGLYPEKMGNSARLEFGIDRE